MPRMRSPEEEIADLQEQLSFCKGKINTLTHENAQLTEAVRTWRWRAHGGGTGLTVARINQAVPLDSHLTTVEKLQRKGDCLRRACLALMERVQPGNAYIVRFDERLEKPQDIGVALFGPDEMFIIEVRLWDYRSTPAKGDMT